MTAAWASSETGERLVLLVRAGGRLVVALPLADVVEILRPLPRQPIGAMPDFVSGLVIIRGKPVPVVELDALLDEGAVERRATRMVVVRAGSRRVALAVEDVIGVRPLPSSIHEPVPPLLRNARSDVIETVGVVDGELSVMLRSAQIIPQDTWDQLQAQEASP